MSDTLLILIFPFVALLIYSGSLRGPFIFDDMGHIPKNPHTRLEKLTLDGIARASFDSPARTRPVANMSFALNYYLDRYNPMGYHLVNILIHVATGLFLYFFVKTTLNILPPRAGPSMNGWIAFFAALIWLVHPVQTQSVSYIVQRMNSLAAMFYVSSLLLYGRARIATERRKKWALFGGCILAGILALGSKEIAATLPFFIFLYEWYFFQDLSWPWLRRHLTLFGGLLILLAILALLYLGINPVERILESYNIRDFTLTQRVLTQFRVVIFYLSLLLFPHPSRLNLDHDFSISHSLLDPLTTMLSIMIIIVLVGLAIYRAKKERLFSFCILWFLGNLVIESSVIGLEIAFEHRNYLPSMLVTIMAVSLAYRHIKPKWLGGALLCALVMVFSFWAHDRNKVWSDSVTLWSDCVAKSPNKARPHSNLGASLALRGRTQEAMNHYTTAVKINPNYAEAHYNMGVALEREGRTDEAALHYTKTLKINTNHAEAHSNIGVTLVRQGNFEEGITHFAEALRIKPHYVKAHMNMGSALLSQGKTDEAVAHFADAVRIEPNNAEAHYNLGVAREKQGRADAAIAHYSKALEINPSYAEAHYNMGVTLGKTKNFDEAVAHFAEALRIRPNYVEAHINMGGALFLEGKIQDAIEHYSKALQINPNLPEAHYNLGGAYLRLGDRYSALREYEILKRLDGELARVLLERINK